MDRQQCSCFALPTLLRMSVHQGIVDRLDETYPPYNFTRTAVGRVEQNGMRYKEQCKKSKN